MAYDQDLHAHHTSYAHIGMEEEIDDLEAPCRRCHDIEHHGRSDLREPKTATCGLCKKKHWNPYANQCDYCERILREEAHGLAKYLPLHPPGYGPDEGEIGEGPTFLELLAHSLPYAFRDDYALLFVAPNTGPELASIFSESAGGRVSVAAMVLAHLYFSYGVDQILDALAILSEHWSHNANTPCDVFPPGISAPEELGIAR
jgi:hypothetical protein